MTARRQKYEAEAREWLYAMGMKKWFTTRLANLIERLVGEAVAEERKRLSGAEYCCRNHCDCDAALALRAALDAREKA